MKLIVYLLGTLVLTYLMILLTDYIYSKTKNTTTVNVTLAVLFFTGFGTLATVLCWVYRLVYRPRV